MVHIPGIKHKAADCISRHPAGDPSPDKMALVDDVSGIASNEITLPTFSETKKHFLSGICMEVSAIQTSSEDIVAALPSDTLPAITWDKVRLATT